MLFRSIPDSDYKKTSPGLLREPNFCPKFLLQVDLTTNSYKGRTPSFYCKRLTPSFHCKRSTSNFYHERSVPDSHRKPSLKLPLWMNFFLIFIADRPWPRLLDN